MSTATASRLPATAPMLESGTVADLSAVYVPLASPILPALGPVIRHDEIIFLEQVLPHLKCTSNLHIQSLQSIRATEELLLPAFRLLNAGEGVPLAVCFVGAGSVPRTSLIGSADTTDATVVIRVYCLEYFAFMAQTSPARRTDLAAAAIYRTNFPDGCVPRQGTRQPSTQPIAA